MSLLERAHHRVKVMIRLLRLQTNTYCDEFLFRARCKRNWRKYLVNVFLRSFVEIARFHVDFGMIAVLLVVHRRVLNFYQLLKVPFSRLEKMEIRPWRRALFGWTSSTKIDLSEDPTAIRTVLEKELNLRQSVTSACWVRFQNILNFV